MLSQRTCIQAVWCRKICSFQCKSEQLLLPIITENITCSTTRSKHQVLFCSAAVRGVALHFDQHLLVATLIGRCDPEGRPLACCHFFSIPSVHPVCESADWLIHPTTMAADMSGTELLRTRVVLGKQTVLNTSSTAYPGYDITLQIELTWVVYMKNYSCFVVLLTWLCTLRIRFRSYAGVDDSFSLEEFQKNFKIDITSENPEHIGMSSRLSVP